MEWYTLKEAAKEWEVPGMKLTREVLYRAVKRGMPSGRIGRHIVVTRKDFDAFVRGNVSSDPNVLKS